MRLTTQAYAILGCNLIILIGVIINLFLIKDSSSTEARGITIMKNIASLLMFIVIMVIQVLSVNCMIVGDCQILAWIIVGFAILGTLSYLSMLIFVAVMYKKSTQSAAYIQ